MKYVFEKGSIMPLCGYDENNNFYKFETGEIIENSNVIEFIKQGISKKTMNIKETEIYIYKIIDSNHKLHAYNYQINRTMNFLNEDKQLLSKYERTYIINNLMNGNFKQELIWGDKNE